MKERLILCFIIIFIITIIYRNTININKIHHLHHIVDIKINQNSEFYNYSIFVSKSPICSNIDNKCFNVDNNNINIKNIDCKEKNFCPLHSFCYLGACVCHPGYNSYNCDKKLTYENGFPYNILDCPNLIMNDTIQLDTPITLIGGEHSTKIANKTLLCLPPTNPYFCSYLCYSHQDYGVAVVPKSLWYHAQLAEGNLWKEVGLTSLPFYDVNDRAIEHWQAFNYLKCLKDNINFGNLIEVGAGPFTQIKGFLYIRPDIIIDKLTIWEPSAQRYIKEVSSCSYKTLKLAKYGAFKGFHDFEVIIKSEGGEYLDHNPVYDTLISINVIEHVQDAFKYFNSLYHALKPNGLLIFHDRYYDDEKSIVGGDHYHPIRIKRIVLDKFLSFFNIIYNNCSSNYDGRKNEFGFYIIARKKQ